MTKHFETWKTLELHPQSRADLIAKLLRSGWKLDESARGMIWNEKLYQPRFAPITEATTVELVKVSLGELFGVPYPAHEGMKQYFTVGEIHERAKAFGLKPCPHQVGLELPPKFREISENDGMVFIAMSAIRDKNYNESMFMLMHTNGIHRLIGERGAESSKWSQLTNWVFIK